jgi:hypothetical protein
MITSEGERPERPTARRFVVVVLLVLGSVFSVATIAAVWTRNLLLDTDEYVATVSPLATDAAIRDTATDRVVDALMSAVDVEAFAADALPESAASFAPVIAAGTRSVVEDATRTFLASDAFSSLWDDANRVAHRQVVTLLTGDGEVVRVDNGVVVIDLAAIAEQIRVQLVDGGLTLLDDVPIAEAKAQLEVMDADELTSVQGGIDLLQRLAWWLPLGVAASFGASVYLSRDRRAATRNVGIALASSTVVLALALGIGRRIYLDTVTDLLDPASAAATFDILTRYVRQGIRFVMAIGALIVVGAWLSGPSASARRVRATLGGATDRTGRRIGGDEPPGPIVSWIGGHRRSLSAGLFAVLGLVVVTLDHPSVGALLTAAVVGVIGWAVIQVTASAARGPSSDAEDPAIGTAAD